MKPALVHCLGVARGHCEAELSPAPPGTPRKGLAPKGERKLWGLELRVRVRGTWPVFPAGDGGGTGLRRRASHSLLPPPPCASQLRPDPLRYCQLKPSSGQGAGGREQPGASASTTLTAGGCLQCPPSLPHPVLPTLTSISWRVSPSPRNPGLRVWNQGAQVCCSALRERTPPGESAPESRGSGLQRLEWRSPLLASESPGAGGSLLPALAPSRLPPLPVPAVCTLLLS